MPRFFESLQQYEDRMQEAQARGEREYRRIMLDEGPDWDGIDYDGSEDGE